MKKLLGKIGDFFSGLFAGAKKAWKKTSPEFQEALLKASGIVAVINSHLEETPDFILEAIEKKFPGVDREKIKEALKKFSAGLQDAENMNSDDLLTLIQNVQKFLANQKGVFWAHASDGLAKVLAIVLAPPGTKFAAIASLLVFVYHTFIKKEK